MREAGAEEGRNREKEKAGVTKEEIKEERKEKKKDERRQDQRIK